MENAQVAPPFAIERPAPISKGHAADTTVTDACQQTLIARIRIEAEPETTCILAKREAITGDPPGSPQRVIAHLQIHSPAAPPITTNCSSTLSQRSVVIDGPVQTSEEASLPLPTD
jgi:hypothetical protein